MACRKFNILRDLYDPFSGQTIGTNGIESVFWTAVIAYRVLGMLPGLFFVRQIELLNNIKYDKIKSSEERENSGKNGTC